MNAGPLSPSPFRRVLRAAAETAIPDSWLVVHGPRRARRVALTFDDGPHELTPAYLDVLDKFGARATFFVIGSEVAARGELVREVTERGHQLGGHGYTHDPFPELWLRGTLRDQLTATAVLLPDRERRFIRPPYGALSVAALLACVRAGFTVVTWSLDSEDWRTRRASDLVLKVSPHTVEPGSIVLLHEGQPWTLEALEEIIPRLQRSGYELVTVSELLSS